MKRIKSFDGEMRTRDERETLFLGAKSGEKKEKTGAGM